MPPRKPHVRMQARRRIRAVLCSLGAALMIALCWQLWHAVQLEHDTRALEVERALELAERILQRAATSPHVLEQLPPAQQCTLDADGVAIDAHGGPPVAWLWPDDGAADVDLVVADRLQRAARAEFAQDDASAATAEFDALLAARLPANQRLFVLVAAAWHSQRHDARERRTNLRDQLEVMLDGLQPADLARPAVAKAVAATLRLAPQHRAPWIDRLVPFLPVGMLAGLDNETWRNAQQSVLQRRADLQLADTTWRKAGDATSGPFLAAGSQKLLWFLPAGDRERPQLQRAALVAPTQWLAAVRAAGESGDLPAWPWLVEVTPSSDARDTVAGIPFLAGLQPTHASALGQRPWLLPAATILLLFAFAFAVWQQFRGARREAAAVAAQAEFLTNVTHELRTPLASIRLLGEMLLEQRAVGRETEYYRMLVGEAARLSMLIENVLDLGRAERGDRTYDPRPLDVHAVASETAALLTPAASPENIEILVAPVIGAAPIAHFDRDGLVQSLVAVLDNARKYGRGPIEVDVAIASATSVQLTVRDHGPGVPEDEHELIFERFVRGQAQRHGTTPGVGIGLHLARTIVRHLGGDLACAPATGACFVFTLPRPPAA